MILFWRGWGIAVLGVWILWLLLLTWMAFTFGGRQPDAVTATEAVDWLFGLSFAMAALSVLGIDRYRHGHPRAIVDPVTGQTMLVPHLDDFMFMRLRVWVYILLAAALGMGIASLMGYGPDW